ncbi:MAG TPA: ABC transporter ATP-binding protein [Candidatus Merdenecus merdavium]|nr:ABC transporter ATP-binding protein [Candidatus Merdenecus merdavium]
MLKIEKLQKAYGKFIAVKSVSFEVPSGKLGILLGPNGAGKSSIIKCIAGLLRYDGDIEIHGKPSKSLEAKKVFAYVPEIPAMFEALTVAEHLEYIRRAYKSDITDQEVEELLKRFELDDKKDKLGSELSKGMMQKVSICCALAVKPKVILFDEPMVGLDPKAIKTLKATMMELKAEGVTLLVSTHMLDMVREIWDVMFIMEQGNIVAEYNRDDVKDQDIDDIFFQVTEGE